MTGSQSQKGAITAPERHYLQNCKQASLLTKTSWGSGQSTSAWEGALVVHPDNRAAGRWQVAATALAKHLITWADRTWEGHKTQAQQSLCLWGLPECLNLGGSDLGGASSPGPAADGSWRSNLEPEQCGQEGYMHREGDRPSVAEALQAHASVICLQHPSLPTAWLNKWALKKKSVHHRPLCIRVEIRHWRDQQTEAITEGTTLEATGNRLKPRG